MSLRFAPYIIGNCLNLTFENFESPTWTREQIVLVSDDDECNAI